MTTMIAEVYDALLSAGADEPKARRAAEVLTEFDSKFDRIERRIDGVERRIDLFEGKVEARFTAMEGRFTTLEATMTGRFTLLYWMMTFLIAMTVSVIVKLFLH